MLQYIGRAKKLISSGTAKDTITLFSGNVLSAFLGFLFVFFTARFIDKTQAGVFFAVTNLAVMVSTVADVGIATGIVNFVSEALSAQKVETAREYMKAALIVRFAVVMALGLLAIISSKFISPTLLATNDPMAGVWVGILIIACFLWMFLPYMLQAKKNFLGAVSTDISFMLTRLASLFAFTYLGGATLGRVFGSYVIAGVVSGIVGFVLIGLGFLKSHPSKEIYKKLFKFSGWIGVSRITASISGNLDVQMTAALLGALSTAVYSIPSKLASFIVVLAGSFSAVTATRLAGFGDKDKERTYLLKSVLVTIPIVAGIIFWIIIANPFMEVLFPKYMDSVPVFRALALANIPFILATPAVTATIYAIKKTNLVGFFSIFQLIIMFILDITLIPKFGVMGPAITLGIVNTIQLVYYWVFVFRYYFTKDQAK